MLYTVLRISITPPFLLSVLLRIKNTSHLNICICIMYFMTILSFDTTIIKCKIFTKVLWPKNQSKSQFYSIIKSLEYDLFWIFIWRNSYSVLILQIKTSHFVIICYSQSLFYWHRSFLECVVNSLTLNNNYEISHLGNQTLN